MLLEISNAQRSQSAPELSSILTTWRERLPNRWEDLPAWNDLVSWRNHMFSHINNVLARLGADQGPAVTTVAMQELLWTNTRFAHVARRQSLPEACVNIISKIQTVASGLPSADLNDGFAKLREQARARLLAQLGEGVNEVGGGHAGGDVADLEEDVDARLGQRLASSDMRKARVRPQQLLHRRSIHPGVVSCDAREHVVDV